jgi:anti-sigma regulatory factor (Ser/Thr protein kinase)
VTDRLNDPVRRDADTECGVVLLDRDVREIHRARDWMKSFWHDRIDRRQLDDACLVISELVTNALRHGLGDVVVGTSATEDDGVRVAVTDWSEDRPRMVTANGLQIGGVGLKVVDHVSTTWGIAPFPRGKTVWAIIDAPRQPSEAAAR